MSERRPPSDRFSRRGLLLGGAAAGVGAAGATVAHRLVGGEPVPENAAPPVHGTQTVAFHGPRQSGVETPPQAHACFVGLDLESGVDAEGVGRLLRLLSDDAARLGAGRAPLADTEPELAEVPARLTTTFGFGRGLVERVDPGAVPSWLGPLPEFDQDDLRPEWGQADLLLQVCADDPVTVSHAARMLVKDARAFAGVAWTQTGFRRAHGSQPDGTTMRNLMGQVDGSINPRPGTEEFDQLVWATGGPAWLDGGTSLVLRRIATDLDTWDELDRPGREAVIGRRVSDGAPLTGGGERDDVDLDATDSTGLPVIPAFAHVRRARTGDPRQRIFRRGYNYDLRDTLGGSGEAGLLFASFQADPVRQFVPIQRRLDELDLLNEWVTAVGSAVFAIPPGCEEGDYVGRALVEG
ncbi:Dyp-type peroxidase [Nocardiopsis sp. NRRL B-16309]|uniref:Dyp-type peroxidase n=1 Tax=Nocardiopsis sp. NRRL B-16309 TaxID=1519494 RepID=UPI0006AF4993|nr:Dyp-type peroxidase [Nocardiopsis sp. NRRL B-16309]KOX22107.1 peroxidase [Nocardiopsis sp. NRRL B-16309]